MLSTLCIWKFHSSKTVRKRTSHHNPLQIDLPSTCLCFCDHPMVPKNWHWLVVNAKRLPEIPLVLLSVDNCKEALWLNRGLCPTSHLLQSKLPDQFVWIQSILFVRDDVNCQMVIHKLCQTLCFHQIWINHWLGCNLFVQKLLAQLRFRNPEDVNTNSGKCPWHHLTDLRSSPQG